MDPNLIKTLKAFDKDNVPASVGVRFCQQSQQSPVCSNANL